MRDPRVLIVGTVPYNQKSTSRAFDSYFHGWDKRCLAQIFSNTKTPVKGHCGTLYQITDKRMLQAWYKPDVKTGVIFEYEDLPQEWSSDDLEVGGGVFDRLYKIGHSSTSFTHLARKLIWKKNLWLTPELESWLDEFDPECVFLSFSNDFFISEIALYVAERYNIPIVSSIGDDYYFLNSRWFEPLKTIYLHLYRKLIDKVLSHGGSAIYIGDKIKKKYNEYFNLNGETVYLTSEIDRREFYPIDPKSPSISYFGNIRMGRNESLCDIADALAVVNQAYTLDVYSNEKDSTYTSVFNEHPNLVFHGSIPYSEVIKMTKCADALVVVEGHKSEDVALSRYSVSTKVADSLASGANVLVYGSEECGAIEYLTDLDCATVCHKSDELAPAIERLLTDIEYQHRNYKASEIAYRKNHCRESSVATFRKVVFRAIADYEAGRNEN